MSKVWSRWFQSIQSWWNQQHQALKLKPLYRINTKEVVTWFSAQTCGSVLNIWDVVCMRYISHIVAISVIVGVPACQMLIFFWDVFCRIITFKAKTDYLSLFSYAVLGNVWYEHLVCLVVIMRFLNSRAIFSRISSKRIPKFSAQIYIFLAYRPLIWSSLAVNQRTVNVLLTGDKCIEDRNTIFFFLLSIFKQLSVLPSLLDTQLTGLDHKTFLRMEFSSEYFTETLLYYFFAFCC